MFTILPKPGGDVKRSPLDSGWHRTLILSGYNNPLYTEFAARHGWRRVDIEIDNKAGGGKEKRKMIECLWMNY